MKPLILIADDNKDFVTSAEVVLSEFKIIKAFSPSEILEKIDSAIDLVLLDLVFDEKKPDLLEGLDLIPLILNKYPDIKIVVLTNYPSINTTVKAIKAGAIDYLNKRDLNWLEWKNRLMNYAKSNNSIRELKQRNAELENLSSDNEIIGNSSDIHLLKRRLQDIALHSDDAVVFITGETGTGKNHAVNYFRKFSPRSKIYKEFSILELSETLIESELFGHVKGAFTGATDNKKGLFEQADGGILFLDEIGDYDLRIQAKLLRFIDEKIITPVGSGKSKKLDLLLILASNQDIPSLIREKRFREDLYQRINRIRIELPPLRKRREDIPILTDYFFNYFKKKEKTKLLSIDSNVYATFDKYQWPGNIRELQSVIWDACTKARLFGDKVLTTKHLKSELNTSFNPPQNTKELTIERFVMSEKEQIALIELESIEKALQQFAGDKGNAASSLKMSSDQMRYKVLKLHRLYPHIVIKYSMICSKYKITKI